MGNPLPPVGRDALGGGAAGPWIEAGTAGIEAGRAGIVVAGGITADLGAVSEATFAVASQAGAAGASGAGFGGLQEALSDFVPSCGLLE